MLLLLLPAEVRHIDLSSNVKHPAVQACACMHIRGQIVEECSQAPLKHVVGADTHFLSHACVINFPLCRGVNMTSKWFELSTLHVLSTGSSVLTDPSAESLRAVGVIFLTFSSM